MREDPLVDLVWDLLDVALLALIAFLAFVGARAWLRPITTTGIVSVAAVVAFFVLGWTQGNKISDWRWTEPVNWPLQIRLLGEYPGVGDGACYSYIEPGIYGRPTPDGDFVEEEITEKQAARQNADVRACRAEAHRSNRDYTKDWANWMAILLLGTVTIAGYDHWGRRQRARDEEPRSGQTSLDF